MAKSHHYLIALGSNRRHQRHKLPRTVIVHAMQALEEYGIDIIRLARVTDSDPIGPSLRRYANSAAWIATNMDPEALLTQLKYIERDYGRRRGRRWSTRVLDLDIILWSGGIHASPKLIIPHPLFRARHFVLAPLAEIARDWVDPITGHSIAQLSGRLRKKLPKIVDPLPCSH